MSGPLSDPCSPTDFCWHDWPTADHVGQQLTCECGKDWVARRLTDGSLVWDYPENNADERTPQ